MSSNKSQPPASTRAITAQQPSASAPAPTTSAATTSSFALPSWLITTGLGAAAGFTWSMIQRGMEYKGMIKLVPAPEAFDPTATMLFSQLHWTRAVSSKAEGHYVAAMTTVDSLMFLEQSLRRMKKADRTQEHTNMAIAYMVGAWKEFKALRDCMSERDHILKIDLVTRDFQHFVNTHGRNVVVLCDAGVVVGSKAQKTYERGLSQMQPVASVPVH